MAFVIGKCLLPIRLKECGMTQQELADKLGMKEQQISDYVHKRKVMSLKTAINVAAVLKCHIDDLYERIYVGDE